MAANQLYPLGRPAFVSNVLDRAAHLRTNEEKLMALENHRDAIGWTAGNVFGSSARSFGSPGAGGSLGFADPDAGVGYAYVMNQMGTRVTGDPRDVALRDALYAALRGRTSARPFDPGAVITSAAPSPLTSPVAMRTPEVIRFG